LRAEGPARPAHDAMGPALPGLGLRAPQGHQRPRAFRGARAPRPHHPPPPLLRPGGRGLWRRGDRRHGDRRDRAGRVASLTSGPYLCRSRRVTSRLMLYVSIFVELLRSRPSLAVWLAALAQALLWLLVPSLFYAGPPGDLPNVLAV